MKFMARVFLMWCFVGVGALCPRPAFALNGDVQGDAQLDVSDVQCMVLAALDLSPGDPSTDPSCMIFDEASDLDCDGAINVVDIQLLVQMVLGALIDAIGMPEAVDGDGDNVHDSCDDLKL